jgi:hypothetical protein
MQQIGPMVRRRRRRPRPLVTPLLIKDIALRLDVTLMTIRSWRMGSPGRWRLPVHTKPKGERHRVLIEEQDLLEFLREFRLDLFMKWNGQ